MSRKKKSPLALVEQRRWTDVAGLAVYLGVAEAWVRRAVQEQTIPYSKMNAHLRFDLDRIDAWVEAHSFGPQAA